MFHVAHGRCTLYHDTAPVWSLAGRINPTVPEGLIHPRGGPPTRRNFVSICIFAVDGVRAFTELPNARGIATPSNINMVTGKCNYSTHPPHHTHKAPLYYVRELTLQLASGADSVLLLTHP